MRAFITLITTFAAGPAFAHIGHLGEVAGHGHWAAAGAIAIALGLAALGARKGKKADDQADAADQDAPEAEEEGQPA